MLPKYSADLKSDFKLVKIPGKTYFYNRERKTIEGFIDGSAALLQAVYLILITNRFEHEIYSRNYGLETDCLLECPEAVVYPRIEQIFTDALMQDDRIFSVEGFDFKRDKGALHVKFTINSDMGNIEINKEMIV